MKKTDYLGLTLAEELDNPGDLKFVNDNPTILDTKIKSIDTDAATLKGRVDTITTSPTILTPTLYNGWVVSSATLWPLQYWKDTDGIVHFRIAVKSGATTPDNAVTIFPTGYRPAKETPIIGHVDGGTVDNAIFTVKTNGNLQSVRTLPDNSLLILNGEFKAV